MTVVSIYFLTIYNLGLPIWAWVLLFFCPDISMLGYLISSQVGALVYNITHHKAVAIIIVALGYLQNNRVLVASGLLLISHSSFDRMFGYGLKYKNDFKHTHLGWIGIRHKRCTFE